MSERPSSEYSRGWTDGYDAAKRQDTEEAITTAIASGRLLDLQSEDAERLVHKALFDTFGWVSRINPDRPDPVDPRGPWQTYDDLPYAIQNSDIDHEEWRKATTRFLQALNPLYDEDAGK